jgi:HEAT repeat protein
MEESDIEEIVELLPRLRRMSRFEAARLVLSVEDTKRVTEWLNDDDIWLRNAAAWRIAAGVQSGEPPTLLSEVLSDPDDEVRTTMIESLEAPLSKDVRTTLLDADRDPRPWTCMRCEQENPATNAGCESCHVVGGDFASKLAKLLKDDGPNK